MEYACGADDSSAAVLQLCKNEKQTEVRNAKSNAKGLGLENKIEILETRPRKVTYVNNLGKKNGIIRSVMAK